MTYTSILAGHQDGILEPGWALQQTKFEPHNK